MRWFHRRSPAQSLPPPDRDALIATWSTAMAALSPHTRACYMRHVQALLPASGCAAFTNEDLEVLTNQIQQEPHSVSWKKQRCAAIRHFLRWAVAAGYAPGLCEAGLSLLELGIPAARRDVSFPGEDQLQRLFGRGTTIRDQLLVALTLELGWVPHRLVMLNCGDIHGTTIQDFPVSRATVMLWHQCAGDNILHSDLPLFRSGKQVGDMRRLSPSQARRILHATAEKVGLSLPLSRMVRRLARYRGIPRREPHAQ